VDIPHSSGPNRFPVGDLGVASCDPYILMIHADGTPTDASNVAVVIGLRKKIRYVAMLALRIGLRMNGRLVGYNEVNSVSRDSERYLGISLTHCQSLC